MANYTDREVVEAMCGERRGCTCTPHTTRFLGRHSPADALYTVNFTYKIFMISILAGIASHV